MSKKYRHHPLEYKQRLLAEIAGGVRSKAAVCREEHLSESLVDRWQQRAREGTLQHVPSALERQQAKELDWYKKKVAELTREIDILKKVEVFSALTRRCSSSVITERTLGSRRDVSS